MKSRTSALTTRQTRGKKNLVISQELAGPVGLFVKFSVLQEYGVDRVFLLENANIDSSQRNVVFLVRGEKAHHVRIVTGMVTSSSYAFLNALATGHHEIARILPTLCGLLKYPYIDLHISLSCLY